MQSIESRGALRVAAAERPEHDRHWSGLVARLPEASGLRPSRSPGAFERIHVRRSFSKEQIVALYRVSRGADQGLHILLTAAVAAVLRRHQRSDEVVIAATPSVATLTEALPILLTVDRSATLRSLLGNAAAVIEEADRFADYPVEILGAAADRYPFADVLVAPVGSDVAPLVEDPRFGVVVGLIRAADGVQVVASASGVHERVGIEAFLEHVVCILDAGMTDPTQPLWDIDLVDEHDQQLIATSNDTAASFQQDERIEAALERQAEATPDRIAVTASAVNGDSTRLTYRELDQAADRLARGLIAGGVRRGDRVAVLVERGAHMLVAIFASLKAGAAYVPVDPTYPAERIEYMLQDSNARAVLASAATRSIAEQHSDAVILADEADVLPADAGVELPGDLSAVDIAYVIYTSGSTGRPKGVQIEHRSVCNRLKWMQTAYPIDADDVLVQKTPISFDVSVWELFWWSFVGARLVLAAPGAEKDPEVLVETVERERVTTMHFVPSMLGALVGYVARTGTAAGLGSLRQVFASGEALGTHHVEQFRTVIGATSQADLINLYGPTEATVDVTHHRCGPADSGFVPIGRPISNTRIHIVDEDLREQPVGVPGELLIAGVQLARGYLDRPELTDERFRTDVSGESRVYRTGDLARWNANGEIEYLGRIDDQVKVRGYRIELGEIGSRIVAVDGVDDAVVIARRTGDDQHVLWGYAATDVDADTIREQLLRSLPEYMVPTHILTLPTFPLTPSGKLDRTALPQDAPQSRMLYVAPRTEAEQCIADIWAAVLSVDLVGVDDNLFALGANSIHFVAVLARSRSAGLDFTFQDLFRLPTVAGLAAEASSFSADATMTPDEPFALISAEDRSHIPADVVDAYPMSQLQVGLVFETELDKSAAGYHDILLYTIKSSLSLPHLEEAVRELIQHTPILRTTYDLRRYSTSLQLVHAEAESSLRAHDLRHLGREEQERWYANWVEEEKADRFQWDVPGLVRIHLHVLDDGLFRYGISQHNSALDGWSITLLHSTLFDIYGRLMAGEPIAAEEPRSFSRAFVQLELEALRDETQRSFWSDVLDGAELTPIPRAKRPDDEQFEVGFLEIDLTDVSAGIKQVAARLDVPIKNVLMAAHVAALGAISGSEDVVTGYEHSGRPEVEGATEAIGLFLNTVPFRVHFDGGDWAKLVRHVHEREIALLPARRYPMAQMKADLGLRAPLFDTAFNFTHFSRLRSLDDHGFELLDVRANSETEFLLRAEYSQHFRTNEIRLSLHYHRDVIPDEVADIVAAAYRAAFTAIVQSPSEPVDVHALLSPAALEVVRPLRPEAVPFATLAASARSGAAAAGSRHPRGDADGARVEGADTSPLTDTEHRLATAWGSVLGVDVNVMVASDNFFLLGGTSLSAMRLAVELGGEVGIADIMRNSELRKLAAVVDARAAETDGGADAKQAPMLQLLAGDPVGARSTLVCFPYAAGSAVAFDAFAAALHTLDPALAVYAVQFPGHDAHLGAELWSLERVAETVANEIETEIASPVVLWGHCVGSAIAIRTAELLERDADGIERLFIGGKVLYPTEDALAGVQEAEAMDDASVMTWLAEEAGLPSAQTAQPGGSTRPRDDRSGDGVGAYLARLFRHDSAEANRYLARVACAEGPQLKAPVTVILTKDDPLTSGGPDPRAWAVLGSEPEIVALPAGGHYFCETAPNAVAEYVAGRLGVGVLL